MAYASWVSSSGLKATGDFLILMSKDGFKSDCAERESSKQSLPKVSLTKQLCRSPSQNSVQLFPIK